MKFLGLVAASNGFNLFFFSSTPCDRTNGRSKYSKLWASMAHCKNVEGRSPFRLRE